MNIRTVLSIIFMLFILGCDQIEDYGVSNNTLKNFQQEAKQIIGDTEISIGELKKLRQVEYHVEVLDIQAHPTLLTATLNKLGKQRWNCYHIERKTNIEMNKEELLVFCQRPVHTPLRYVPRGLIGG